MKFYQIILLLLINICLFSEDYLKVVDKDLSNIDFNNKKIEAVLKFTSTVEHRKKGYSMSMFRDIEENLI